MFAANIVWRASQIRSPICNRRVMGIMLYYYLRHQRHSDTDETINELQALVQLCSLKRAFKAE